MKFQKSHPGKAGRPSFLTDTLTPKVYLDKETVRILVKFGGNLSAGIRKAAQLVIQYGSK